MRKSHLISSKESLHAGLIKLIQVVEEDAAEEEAVVVVLAVEEEMVEGDVDSNALGTTIIPINILSLLKMGGHFKYTPRSFLTLKPTLKYLTKPSVG